MHRTVKVQCGENVNLYAMIITVMDGPFLIHARTVDLLTCSFTSTFLRSSIDLSEKFQIKTAKQK